METETEIGENYRLLNKGEKLQDFDECFDPHQQRWYWTKCAGLCVGDQGTMLKYRRAKGAK